MAGRLIGMGVFGFVALGMGNRLALACSVCFSSAGSSASRLAYYITTGFMTALPFLLVFGLFVLIRRNYGKKEEPGPEKRDQHAKLPPWIGGNPPPLKGN